MSDDFTPPGVLILCPSEEHLLRLLREFLEYDRTHLSLGKDPPTTPAVCPPTSPRAPVASLPRVGGLHHRHEWRDAARRRWNFGEAQEAAELTRKYLDATELVFKEM